jgi:antitoxin (DNA-binding transcriptional repressor) of toxin-antitoxin stability system
LLETSAIGVVGSTFRPDRYYRSIMGNLSAAETVNHISERIGRVPSGEKIFITHNGRPVMVVRPIQQEQRRLTACCLERLAVQRGSGPATTKDAATSVCRRGDEGSIALSGAAGTQPGKQPEQNFQPAGCLNVVGSPPLQGRTRGADGRHHRTHNNLLTPHPPSRHAPQRLH